jgi:hypothetical protein
MKSLLAQVDELEANQDSFDELATIIRREAKRQLAKGNAHAAQYCAVEHLSPRRARQAIAEMIAGQREPVALPLTVPDAAKRLKVSPAKLRGWIKSGRIAATNVNRPSVRPSYRITPEAIRELETRSTPPTALPTVPKHYAA